jgi:hypothetical protein
VTAESAKSGKLRRSIAGVLQRDKQATHDTILTTYDHDFIQFFYEKSGGVKARAKWSSGTVVSSDRDYSTVYTDAMLCGSS